MQWRAHISIKVQNLLWRNHNWDSTYWALMVEYYVLLTVSCLCSISILSANECLHDQLNMYVGGASWARVTKNVQKPAGWKRKNMQKIKKFSWIPINIIFLTCSSFFSWAPDISPIVCLVIPVSSICMIWVFPIHSTSIKKYRFILNIFTEWSFDP